MSKLVSVLWDNYNALLTEVSCGAESNSDRDKRQDVTEPMFRVAGENTNQTPEQNRQTGSPSATLFQLKQSLKQTQWWILASIGLLITGDIWNIALHVHTRPYTIGYHVVNGHKIFCYVESSKWWSDFIGTKGYSIGDLLIYAGVALLTIIAIVLIWNILNINGNWSFCS